MNDQRTTVTSNNQTTMDKQSDRRRYLQDKKNTSSGDQIGSQKHIKNKSPYGLTPERVSNTKSKDNKDVN